MSSPQPFIPIARPNIDEREIDAVSAVLRSGMIAQGRVVAELEREWAEYVGVRHAVAVANGTLALMAILAGLQIGPGDEVITVSHTFAATANAILSTGATPVFVDIDPRTYLMDPSRIEDAITPATKAIMPVHLFGLVCDMDEINEIAMFHDLAVIEDACQAHGAQIGGRMAGSLGRAAAFSLYATKNMTTSEGGLITTDDGDLADWLRVYRNQGMRSRYEFEMLGFNYRMTDVAAAMGRVQFEKLEPAITRRTEIAGAYTEAFASLPIGTPLVPDLRRHVYHQYTIDVGSDRDIILSCLRELGIGADVYYPKPVHRQLHIAERAGMFYLPSTDRAAAQTIALPIFPTMTEGEIERVIAGVTSVVV